MLELKTALEKPPWYSAFTFPVVPLPVGRGLNSSGAGNALMEEADRGERACIYDGRAQTVG